MVPAEPEAGTGPFKRLGGQHFIVVRCTYKTKTDELCNGFFTLISETNPFDFYCVFL
jgi:hypothetical protein